MTARSCPVPGARAAVSLAARILPTRADRSRYLDEFLGDLHALPAGEQLRYAAGVLSSALRLRAALLADPGTVAEPVTRRGRWRSLRCHILRIHYWRTYSTDDGSRYVACSVCKREHPGTGTFPGNVPGPS
jgi:hypothetical protein